MYIWVVGLARASGAPRLELTVDVAVHHLRSGSGNLFPLKHFIGPSAAGLRYPSASIIAIASVDPVLP